MFSSRIVFDLVETVFHICFVVALIVVLLFVLLRLNNIHMGKAETLSRSAFFSSNIGGETGRM